MSKKKRNTVLDADPHRGQEKLKYDSPVASRDYIRQVLIETGSPLFLDELFERFQLQDDAEQQEALRRRVSAMIRDGQLIRNRKGALLPVDESDLISGYISAHPDGFGFLLVDGGSDIYLSGKQMRRVLHGDRAIVCITGVDRRGRREGRIVEVIERANQQIVGRFMAEQGVYFIAPDNRRIHQDLLIPDRNRGDAKTGDMVIAKIVEQPTSKHGPVGKVVTILGQHLRPGMETDVAIASHGIPYQWPKEVQDSITGYGIDVIEADKVDRKDVRSLPLVTIDGEDARDFDDAVYCEKKDDGWRLFVAIADVSHYVTADSALDHEARARGTSVYFPSRVVPMLPEALSNGLCSLNPDVDRLCMLCEMTLDKSGDIKRTRFSKALMRSHARLTYTVVGKILQDKDKNSRREHESLVPHLDNLHALYKVLVKRRKRRGAIEFESNESRIIFDEQQKIKEIVPVVRNDAHKLIEECMILANRAAALYLEKRRMPALYRVHAHPNADRLDDLRSFLALRGLSLGGGESPKPLDYAKLAKQLGDRLDAPIIQTMMLRSMQQAVYQPENEGHFGLALEHYAHFTSPIRRYPDLLVHRAIEFVLNKGKVSNYRYSREDMVSLGESCSMTERRADEATRDVTSWLKCEYMLEHVGDEFDGVISSVTSFGLFVQLQGVFVEGLVHITSLSKDYYNFDQAAQTLTGERSGTRYELGDSIRVVVAAVNLEDRKIDFDPIDAPAKKSAKREKRKTTKALKPSDKRKSKKSKDKKRKNANAKSKSNTVASTPKKKKTSHRKGRSSSAEATSTSTTKKRKTANKKASGSGAKKRSEEHKPKQQTKDASVKKKTSRSKATTKKTSKQTRKPAPKQTKRRSDSGGAVNSGKKGTVTKKSGVRTRRKSTKGGS